ncbi:MAG TPA: hypothetical protein VGL86_05585 [Polyangia bacterium]|jgi:predicted amidophosphoribosyltransferase
MANCPSCNASVEDGADLCLECGEPMGDSPAAKAARSDPPAPTASPRPVIAKPTAPPPKTMPATPVAKKKWAEEPEPLRCPGCGLKSHAARCPDCGTRLRHDDD